MNEEQKIQAEREKFQSNTKLALLKVHAVWTKVENVLLFIPRWISNKVSSTEDWIALDKRIPDTLRVVK